METESDPKKTPERIGKHADWKSIIPFRSIPRDKRHELPVEHVGLFSYVLLTWLDGFMWRAFRGRVDGQHLWACPEVDSAEVNGDRLETLWKEELAKNGRSGASLSRVFMRFVKRRWIAAGLLLTVALTLLLFSVAYVTMNILRLTVEAEAPVWEGLVLVGALFLTSILSQIAFIVSVTITHTAAGRLRSGVLILTFRKLMRMSSLQDKTIGKVVNLVSNDGTRLFDGISMGHMIISGPLLVVGSTAYAIYLLGAWALIGLGILLLLLPLQMTAGKILMNFRGQAIILTDNRVRLMTEYLANIRFVKMYSWEKAVINIVVGARAAEQKILEKANISLSLVFMIAGILVSIATMSTLIAYTMSGNHLSSGQAFMYLLIYTCIQDKLELCMLSIKLFSEVFVAAKRFQEVLMLDDDVSSTASPNKYRLLEKKKEEDKEEEAEEERYALQTKDLVFRWPCTRAILLEDDDASKTEQADKHAPANKRMNGKERKRKDNVYSVAAAAAAEATELQIPLVDVIEREHFGKFDLNIEKSRVIGIMGPVSSGKTSLIRALLGQMDIVEGSVVVGGTMAYVPQQAWIFNATVRENILLGAQMEEDRYRRVLECCCMTEDLDVLVDGDMTEIGERGVTLSGGQRQRISLARALYSNRDIYLLDDPLASVDPDVAETIFNRTVLDALLGKTVLLVTHQIKFLSQCDLIICLSERQVVETGSNEELLLFGGIYASSVFSATSGASAKANNSTFSGQTQSDLLSPLLPQTKDLALKTKDTSTVESPAAAAASSAASAAEEPASSALITAEEVASGSIPLSTYMAYIRSAGGLPVAFGVTVVCLFAELCRAFSFWWLAYWLEQGSGGVTGNVSNMTVVSDNISDNPHLWMYNLVYGMTLVAIIVFFTLRSVTVVKVLMRASSRLHDGLFHKVMRAPVLFFDRTPLGRVINRFSRDMDEMDSKLPMLIENTVKSFLNIVIYVALTAAIMPWFLVAVPLAGIVFFLLYVVFRAGIRELQRLNLVSMSPMLSHVDAAVRGLSSIQAYGKKKDFEAKFRGLLDHNTVVLFLCHFSARWVGIRLAFITTTLLSCTTLIVILLKNDISTSYSGVAIVYTLQLLTLFQLFVRFAVDAGATFASTERIHNYTTTLKEEGPLTTKTFALPKDWPHQGQITFTDLRLRYREDLPFVLDGISFLALPREKVGIVGRTGSGKSSLVGALFRLTGSTEGRIDLDDVDISLIGLEDLRSKLSIIPQDPVLFSGTIRSNLDPFDRHIDQELWHALDRCHLKETVVQMEGQLSSKVMENGENLSQGERQLLAMARVLLRHTRIIILDEATASLDDETEDRIQQTIAETFADCTVLFIAHRLRTILKCDRVLVMDDGKIVEFDKPSSLLADPNSRLSRMVSVYSSAGSDSPGDAPGSALAFV